MVILGLFLIVVGITAAFFAFYNVRHQKVKEPIALVCLFVGVILFVIGLFLFIIGIGKKESTDRCQVLQSQHKEVLSVNGECWVSLGNDLFIQSNSQQTEIKTRAELTAE